MPFDSVPSERNVIPRSDEKAPSYSNSMVEDHKILSQPLDTWKIGFYFEWCYFELFIVCLAATMTEITAAKKTRLFIHF